MLTVINVFSQRARGVWQTVNKAWQSFKKSHRRWLLQIQESCKFMIWQILLMFHCWQPQDPQRYRFWLDELKKVPSQMTQVYERTQEREEEWMVARHWHHRKNKTWTMSHNCGLYIPKYRQVPPVNSHYRHSHSSFLRGLFLEIAHSIVSHTQSDFHRRASFLGHTYTFKN